MAKVSVNILTRNRKDLLKKCLDSVSKQSFKDVELIVINDGSTDGTLEEISNIKFQIPNKIINHKVSVGITLSRQEALMYSSGDYIAILDDDDEWIDKDKLLKQVEYLDKYPEVVLAGGGIKTELGSRNYELRMRTEGDIEIRNSMLYRNNFFTSTVMFRRQEALDVGGFEQDEIDLAEDYDLWLRLGKVGKMRNFQEVFTSYRKPVYNKEKLLKFYEKQQKLIFRHKHDYPFYFFAALILKLRTLYEKIF
ncbi:MAG: glycosyltransferase [Candidatus Doudnabacteria bacterium]|nr:glycosyltransferase [Candidatus Doudnabacteria bacterium]